MDINIFFTQTAQTGSQTQNGKGAPALLGGGNGIFSGIPGLNFLDLLFGGDGGNGAPGEGGTTLAGSPDFSPHLAKLAAFKAQTPDNGKILPLDAMPADINNINNNDNVLPEGAAALLSEITILEDGQLLLIEENAAPITPPDLKVKIQNSEKLITILENLTGALPAENKAILLPVRDAELGTVLKDLNIDPARNNGRPALIATGLSPEELTVLIEDIINQNDSSDKAVLLGIIQLVPPPPQRNDAFFARTPLAQAMPSESVKTPQLTGLQKALGALEKSGGRNSGDPINANAGPNITDAGDADADAVEMRLTSLTRGESANKNSGGFERILQMIEQAQAQTAHKPGAPLNAAAGGNGLTSKAEAALQSAQSKSENAAARIGPGLSTFQNNESAPPPVYGALLGSAAWDSIYPDGLDFAPKAIGQVAALNLNGTGLMTSLTGHAPHAGQPHPATQMVASTIARTSASGESRNIVIRLDPPELGRVEVRMDFAKDKNSLKTHLVVEKPETFMMLQRDAHVLERILQSMGMDTDSGLSFELAQDGSLFDHNEGRGGSNDSGAGGNGSEQDEDEIIETTMDWHIDPSTGMTHYNLLV